MVVDPLKHSTKGETPIDSCAKAVFNGKLTTS